jgi:hypothetical protein
MTTTDAANKSCPFNQEYHCQVNKCMAWQATSTSEGFCVLMSRSRKVALMEAIAIKTDEPLGVRLEQGEYDCFKIEVNS